MERKFDTRLILKYNYSENIIFNKKKLQTNQSKIITNVIQ